MNMREYLISRIPPSENPNHRESILPQIFQKNISIKNYSYPTIYLG